MNLLKLHAIGHASTKDPFKISNIAAAGLGPEAQVSTSKGEDAKVIDAGQQLESDVLSTTRQLDVIPIRVPHFNVLQHPGQTWHGETVKIQHLTNEVIPWLEG